MERANQAKDEFLALVSHELRTPVTTILGFAEILTRHYRTLDTDTIEGSLLDIRDAAHRMHRLVDDLLTLSRSERKAPVELEPVSLERLVQTVMDEHCRLYPARSVILDVRGPLPPVLGHALYLEHVLSNLLNNAEKYSPADQSIEVACWQDGGSVLITVQDRGVGVLPEETERIFESFYRSSRTRHMPGAGLGLSVCKRLVEAQAGRIWVEPRSGGGSTFCVSLRAAG